MSQTKSLPSLPRYVAEAIPEQIRAALTEDIGNDFSNGDLTARLIPDNKHATATIISREPAILCGQAWVEEVFTQLGNGVSITWKKQDGDLVQPNEVLCELEGNARQILTGERTALNFLQTLSATATTAHQYAQAVADQPITILDTRKTIPGLRGAQKYAVTCGGCQNHRIGLFDAFLIKENHIAACGSISLAITTAREISPDTKVIVEVETLTEFAEAISAKPDQIMLDEFELSSATELLYKAKETGIAIELSGSFDLEKIASVELPEAIEVFISIGATTKHVRAIDLSLRLR